MGRQAVDKKRISERTKVKKWVEDLLPKLSDVDLGNLTIDELAALMQKSKSTIYQYFKSKEDIITYMVEVRLEKLRPYADILGEEPFELEAQYPKFVFLFSTGTNDITPVFMRGLQAHYPVAWALVDDFLNELVDAIANFYEKGVELGIFYRRNTELLAQLDRLFISQLVTDPTTFGSDLSLTEVILDYIVIRLNGIKVVE